MAPKSPARVTQSDTLRVLVLAGAHSYRLEAFQRASDRLGVAVVRGLDAPPAHTSAGLSFLRLDFRAPERAPRPGVKAARSRPFPPPIPTHDGTAPLAARLALARGPPHTPP